MSNAQSEAAEARKLPIIDVSGLHGGAIDRRAVAQELRLACSNTGFFYVTGHGVPTGQIDQVVQQSREFFGLPMEEKLALSMTQSACRHGYEPLKAQTLEAGAPPDLKEGFLAGEDLAADHPAVRNDPANIGPNQWPPHLPEFKGVMVCLLHYPPQPPNPAPNEKGCGARTDWGGITVLLQDSAGGLQVQQRRSETVHQGACRWLLDLGATDRRHVCGEHRRSFRALDEQPVSIHGSSGYQQIGARPRKNGTE